VTLADPTVSWACTTRITPSRAHQHSAKGASILHQAERKGTEGQEQLEKYPDAKAFEIEEALNEAAQQDLVVSTHKLVSVNAPEWLHMKAMAPKIISPKPKFIKLD
jgi:hypothetical protein